MEILLYILALIVLAILVIGAYGAIQMLGDCIDAEHNGML